MIKFITIFSIFVTMTLSADTEINGVIYTIGPNQTYINADFSNADFSGVDFSGSTFTNCNLNHVSFNGASLIGTVFSYDRSLGRHDLSINLDFDNANLSGSTFINVDLHNQMVHQGPASFVNAILIGMTLYNYHMDTDPLDFRLPQYYTFIPVDGSVGIIIGPYVNLSGQDLTSLSNTVNNVDLRGSAYLKTKNCKSAFISFGFDNGYKCSYEIWGSQGSIFTEKAYTPRSNMFTKLILENKNGREIIDIEPDNHFVNILIEFYDSIINEKPEIHYKDILEQSYMIEQIFEKDKINNR